MSINRITSLSSYHPLFTAVTPKMIKISYQTPSTDNEIIEIDPHLFAKERGMQDWLETILVDQPLLNPLSEDEFPGQTIHQKKLNKILSRTELNVDKLVISYMGKTVGWGVFARDTIAKSDYVAIYSGIQLPINRTDHFTAEQAEYFFQINENDQEIGAIDPKEYGNISRFFQHLPMSAINLNMDDYANEIIFEDYQFDTSLDKLKVATANLLAIPFKYKQSSIIVLQAMRQIEKNECVGFDYGNFWLNYKKHPCLFNKNGTLVDPQKYQPTRWICRTYAENKGKFFIQAYMNHSNLALSNTSYEFSNATVTCKISSATFLHALANTPNTSPYIFIDKPDEIKLFSDLSIQPKESISPTINQSIFQPGFFGKVDQQICEELSRITHHFLNVKWTYHKGKKIAFLKHKDPEIVKTIENYLNTHDCQTQAGHDKNTKHPLLYVKNPAIAHLRKIEAYQLPTVKSSDKLCN